MLVSGSIDKLAVSFHKTATVSIEMSFSMLRYILQIATCYKPDRVVRLYLHKINIAPYK